jgi:hypothetical protein
MDVDCSLFDRDLDLEEVVMTNSLKPSMISVAELVKSRKVSSYSDTVMYGIRATWRSRHSTR